MYVLVMHVKAFALPAVDDCMVEGIGGGCNNQKRFVRHDALVYISRSLFL